MTITDQEEAKKENASSEKNAFLVKPKKKLQKDIKNKIKQMDAIWLQPYQGYACPIEQKSAIQKLLDPWKAHLSYLEISVDPSLFSKSGKGMNNRELRISILEEEIYRESMQLLADIYTYNVDLSEIDFDQEISKEGKTSLQIQKEAIFYQRRQSILEKKRELNELLTSTVKVERGKGSFFLDQAGLWDCRQAEPLWVSSPIKVTARVRDEYGFNHGKLLEFDDADGVHHTWSMPMTMLAGDCAEFRSALLNAGLQIATSPKQRQALAEYIQRANPIITARCVPRTGWYKNGFVLPEINIGDFGREKILIQSKACNFMGYGSSGSLLNWQKNVSDLCVGNSRLIFAVSAAFAGPLLYLTEAEPGGFHFCSHSSSGKTTILRVASSIYGGKDFMRKWKATLTGLETIAFQHNDTLLCLDEIGEMSAFELGEAAYMLPNGAGKGRGRAEGGLRETLSWRVLFLSSGEISLATHMEQAGKQVRAGQEIRLAEISSDTGKYGSFEQIHGFANGADFADALSKNAQRYHGTAGIEFLQCLTKDLEGAKAFLQDQIEAFLKEAVPKDANGQIYRVAKRFALVAAAGELATHYNITNAIGKEGLSSAGWKRGEAFSASLTCFQNWLENFGGSGLQEKRQLLADVSYFLEQHGESRFSEWGDKEDMILPALSGSRTHNRVGFRKCSGKVMEYYIFLESFKRDICKGRSEKWAKQVLYEEGILKRDAEGKFTCPAKPASESKTSRFYVLQLPNQGG